MLYEVITTTTIRGLKGTPRYMSPEQIRDEVLDHRTDIFSFGAVLYELLSGVPAFPGDFLPAILNAILHLKGPGFV